MSINAHQLEEVIALAARMGVHGFNLSQFVPTGRGQRHLDVNPMTARALLEIWLTGRKAYPGISFTAHSAGLADLEPASDHCIGGCQAGLGIGCITAEGDVTPCVMFPYKLGNLNERSFAQIWIDAQLRGKLASREVNGACGTCAHRVACGGCRGAAWAYTGDPLAEDPRCWVGRSHSK
jgi:radical SAM protein with 4Fe4S-binding SPASM domain